MSTDPLILAGCCNALAALAHVVCAVVGAPGYRLLGAGERMARAAQAGHWQPAAVTLAMAALLGLWALVAFSGAGLLPRMPLTRPALVMIGGVYLARALMFPLLMKVFPGNSQRFWLWSSGICLLMGSLHIWGTLARWDAL